MPKKKKPYRSKVKIGVGPDGKDINKWIQGRTRDELRQAREAVIARYITGEALADDRLFGDYATEWYRVKKEPFASPSSRESYRTALNKDLLPPLGDRCLRAITSMDLQQIVNRLAGRSATKITVVMAAMRGIFGSARADRLIDTDPTEALIRPAATPPKPKPALTEAQRAAIVRVSQDHLYLALMYYLGLRPGEARGLQWQDIDWDARRVTVERDIDYKAGSAPGELKTEASRRVVPMPDQLARILWPIRGLPGTYIAHGRDVACPLAKTSAERLWVEMMAEAGLTVKAEAGYRLGDPRSRYAPVITPHALRHNYITMCWETGLDPYETMKLVGHVSITTTMNIYTHLSEAQMEKTARKLDSMFVPRVAKKLHRPG